MPVVSVILVGYFSAYVALYSAVDTCAFVPDTCSRQNFWLVDEFRDTVLTVPLLCTAIRQAKVAESEIPPPLVDSGGGR